ncbi:MOSC domain-containing protein [Halalkalibacter alkalisediminis]|uniref:MOSC domain-containing protein n=1 Tax=Halalkalibacter alkalisediminis TaxID=935616 RepID=A0ABV6NNS7_9BACI|nr:MOSC domain-containing protein [Halalkalibacter alkalisediminis]
MQQMGTILSLNIGVSQNIGGDGDKKIISAIYKNSVSEKSLFLSKTGLEGDQQADLVNHGGIDKAVCIYPIEHYAYWEKELEKTFPIGSFGENMTLAGMVEKDTHIGDIWQWGEAVVQVSQPRRPCYKVAKRHQEPKLPLLIQQTGYSGYYLRVLKEGYVSVKDRCVLTERKSDVSIKVVNHTTYQDQNNERDKHVLLNLNELSVAWKKSLL